MADSSITKRALANSLKELMEEKSFKKISISDICDRCQMNRKSFYYHFRDKYDLVIWIFDTECNDISQKYADLDRWDYLNILFRYFDDNKGFYCKCLEVEGQNSLSEHFMELLVPKIKERLQEIMAESNLSDFQSYFLADAVCCAVKRWLTGKEQMSCEDFLQNMKTCICAISSYVASRDDL